MKRSQRRRIRKKDREKKNAETLDVENERESWFKNGRGKE